MRLFVLAYLCAGVASSATVPGVVSFSSNLVFPTTTPASLRSGSLESNTTVFGFVETIGFVLGQALPVEIIANGADNYDSIFDLTPGSLPVGMPVNSYFLHFDPVGLFGINRNPGLVQIQFDPSYRIAGIQMSILTLNVAATSQVKIPGVTYENRILFSYGLEMIVSDWIHLLDDRTMQINLNSSLGAVDDLRILVETPEPGGPLLAGSAFGLLLWAGRRRLTRARDKPGSIGNNDTGL
jgi:hypothetical protein